VNFVFDGILSFEKLVDFLLNLLNWVIQIYNVAHYGVHARQKDEEHAENPSKSTVVVVIYIA